MDFIDALKIATGVFDQYKIDQLKWWKKMDGTPILNDVAVRMAMEFVHAWNDEEVADHDRLLAENEALKARVAELEAATYHLGLTPQQAKDGLVRYKAGLAERDKLQSENIQLKNRLYGSAAK